MKPLLTMSEAQLAIDAWTLCGDGDPGTASPARRIVAELDAQRAVPSPEPAEFGSAEWARDVLAKEVERLISEHHALTCLVDRLRRDAAAVRRQAIEVINALRRGSCWCEVAIGNPMMSSHSHGCVLASQFALEGLRDGERKG